MFWLNVATILQDVLLCATVVLFLVIPKTGRRQHIEFGLLIIASAITESISWTEYLLVPGSNINLNSSIATIFFFALTVLLYRKQLQWLHRNLITYAAITIVTMFAVINLFFIQGVSTINSNTRRSRHLFTSSSRSHTCLGIC